MRSSPDRADLFGGSTWGGGPPAPGKEDSMKKTGFRCLALCLTVLLFALVLPLPALAAVPDRPGNQYVLDDAGVLSEAFEQEIVEKNQKLFRDSGAEIAVVAVDFLGGREIDDYACDLFLRWGIGSKERNNGLLLVLAIAEDDYFSLPGYGIEDAFSGGRLQSMLDDYLEEDFAAGNYESGVEKFFDAAYAELSAYQYQDEYGQRADGFSQGGDYEDWSGEYDGYDSSMSDLLFPIPRIIFRIIAIVVILVLVFAVLRAVSRINAGGRNNYSGPGYPQYHRGSGNFWTGMFLGRALGRRQSRRPGNWGAPPPPPPPGGFGGPAPRPPRSGSGFGSFGGFSRGGSSRPSGGSRRSSFGGFSRGGGTRGGGAGRRK